MAKKTVVTSALVYANGSLHVGHLVEYIQTDMYVRFLRLKGIDAVYVCADDTHGAPIQINADKLGITPKQLIEKMYTEHVRDFKAFGISFDNYYTTHSDETKHFSDLMFERARENGFIYKKPVSLLYCPKDKMFLPDRYVKGICPKCGSEEQYGDVCEKCGATYKPVELSKPHCAICGTEPVQQQSEHYFFKLSSFEKQLRKWLKNKSLQEEIVNSVSKWVEEGLSDWDITRDGPYFGFPVPKEDNLYYYVWWDAPIGYIGSLANLKGDGEKEWNSSDIIHFIGKDIIYFHFLFWPAVLSATGFQLPKTIKVHGFLTVNGEKMSKSRGTFFTAEDYLRNNEAEHLRYYYASGLGKKLMDLDLNFDELKAKVNNELVANTANFCNRTISFANRFLDSRLGKPAKAKDLTKELEKMQKTIEMHFEDLNFKEAVKEILAYSSLANKYFQEQKPWELVKENPDKAREVICLCANICKNICVMMQPIMPNFSSDLQKQLNIESISWKDLGFKLKDHTLGSAHILVNKIEEKPEFALNLKVAEILEAKPHPDADKLLVMKIDLGLEKRQIVAGLKAHYLPEELIGKKVIVVSNLKPAKLRGELSQGMLLAADDGTKVRIIHPNAAPGTVLLLAGHKVMTEELTIDKFQKLNKLRLKDKKLTYDGLALSDGAEIEIDMPDTSQVR